MKSELTALIIIGDEAVGVLHVESPGRRSFKEKDARLSEILVMHVASEIERLQHSPEAAM